MESHFQGHRRILVAAAGGGRELLALARRGFVTAGFECHRELCAAGRRLLDREGVDAELRSALPSEVPPGLGRFDGAVIGWGAYTHVPGRGRRVRFLTGLAANLPEGGPLLLSFMTRRSDSAAYRWIAAIANLLRRLRLCRERAEIGDTMAGTFDHHFTDEEVAAELAAAGFELVDYRVEPYGHAVARRRAAADD